MPTPTPEQHRAELIADLRHLAHYGEGRGAGMPPAKFAADPNQLAITLLSAAQLLEADGRAPAISQTAADWKPWQAVRLATHPPLQLAMANGCEVTLVRFDTMDIIEVGTGALKVMDVPAPLAAELVAAHNGSTSA